MYDARKYSKEYVPYREGKNLVLTSFFVGQPDPQRGESWKPDASAVMPLFNSIPYREIMVLNDCMLIPPPNGAGAECLINPYFQRWISYRKYLIDHRHTLGFVWCVDATDVIMLNNPYPHMSRGVLYTGDEPGTVNNAWLKTHHKHPVIQNMIIKWRTQPLLNAGILGGDVDTVIDFCGKMIDYYTQFEEDAKLRRMHGAGLTDMGVFNLVAYSHFKPVHGRQVTTVFKAEQTQSAAWWKHK